MGEGEEGGLEQVFSLLWHSGRVARLASRREFGGHGAEEGVGGFRSRLAVISVKYR